MTSRSYLLFQTFEYNIYMDSKRVNHAIRNYVESDLTVVLSKHREMYDQFYHFRPVFMNYVEKHLMEFHQNHHLKKENLWIAEDQRQQFMGTVAIVQADEDLAQLRWFLVDPSAQGKGVGRSLMKQAIQFCKDHHYRHIFLWTAHQLHVARYLYESFSFACTERKENTEWSDELILEERYDLDLNHCLS